jgi:hypothetical protein
VRSGGELLFILLLVELDLRAREVGRGWVYLLAEMRKRSGMSLETQACFGRSTRIRAVGDKSQHVAVQFGSEIHETWVIRVIIVSEMTPAWTNTHE